MKKYICLFVLIFFFLNCNNQTQQQEFVPFYPVYKDKNQAYSIRKEYAPTMRKNMLQLLNYYKVPYKIEGELILIPQVEYENKELMRNYTNKSMDKKWLQEHPDK